MKEDTCIFIVTAVLQALFTKAARFGETGKKAATAAASRQRGTQQRPDFAPHATR